MTTVYNTDDEHLLTVLPIWYEQWLYGKMIEILAETHYVHVYSLR